jgi:transcriptional regulator with XRE-family HTH domain
MLKDTIRRCRLALGLKQWELAARVGCNRVTIAHYEAGRVVPPLDVLKALATAFQISLDELVKDGPTPEEELEHA